MNEGMRTAQRDEGLAVLRAAMEHIKNLPKPKFDRVAVREHRVLGWIPKRQAKSSPFDVLPDALAGIPVVLDDELELGVVEFRLGDEVYKRFYVAELRA